MLACQRKGMPALKAPRNKSVDMFQITKSQTSSGLVSLQRLWHPCRQARLMSSPIIYKLHQQMQSILAPHMLEAKGVLKHLYFGCMPSKPLI